MSRRVKKILSHALIFISLLLITSPNVFATQYVKSYLETVYPTSAAIKNMTDKDAYNYYSKLNFWYRIPMPGFSTGIFNPDLKPQYHVFLFPDTCMRIETNLDQNVKNGFTTDKVIEGSNKHYIEVSSFGWMMFPYGAYYNWSKGSGIYLYTGGKTISAFNKISVVYKMYQQKKALDKFYQLLGRIAAVKEQILGIDSPMTEKQYEFLTAVTAKPDEWKTMPKDAASHLYKPLAVGIMYDKDWPNIQQKLISLKTPEKAYDFLVKLYVKDHNSGNYDQSKPRYQYFVGEANADIDAWMYDVVKEAGYNVIQMTLEPNSAGSPTFEICDVRWPKVTLPGLTPAQLGSEAIGGLQAYNLKYIWGKVIKDGWLQVRDPFDLMNNNNTFNISVKYPKNTPVDSKFIKNPPSSFPKSWLPKDGWGVNQAKNDGYISTDSFMKWVTPAPAPKPLKLPRKNNLGSFIKFGLNDVGHGGFSAVDLTYNINLFKKNLKK